MALILPALDEEQALELVLREIPDGIFDRIVVVDNGSTDRTSDVARAAGAEVVSEPRRGYGRACSAGIAHLTSSCRGESDPLCERDIVAFLDADHSDHAQDIERVIEPLIAGRADLVLGSRVLGGANMRAMLPQAWFGNRLASVLMRLLFGARYTDLGPMRALHLDALNRLRMSDPTFGWTVEMQLKAHSLGLRILEVPVRYRPRLGRSKITGTVAGTVRAGVKILGWIFLWRMRTWFRREP